MMRTRAPGALRCVGTDGRRQRMFTTEYSRYSREEEDEEEEEKEEDNVQYDVTTVLCITVLYI
jgi:hypothetical protein